MQILKNNLENANIKSICYIDSCIANDIPIISFIIPTFNRTEKLKSAVLSINQQVFYYPYEIVIMDNSSIDCSHNENYKLLKELKIHNLRYYINEINLGPTGNWNRGIELSRGQYISFLHDDDLLNYNYGLSTFNALKTGQKIGSLGFIVPRYKKFLNENELTYFEKANTTGKIKNIKKIDSLITGFGPTQTPTCGMIFNRTAVFEVGGFESYYHPSDDHLLGYRILSSGYKGYLIKDVVGFYRIDDENETWNKNVQVDFIKKDFEIREIMYKDFKVPNCIARILRNVSYSMQVKSCLNVISTKNIEIDFNEINFKPELYDINVTHRILYVILFIILKVIRKLRPYY